MDEPQEDSENPRVSLSDTSWCSAEEHVSNIIFDSCSPRGFENIHLYRISPKLSINCGSSAEFWIEPIQTCVEDIDVLSYDPGTIAFSRDVPMLPPLVRHCTEEMECYHLESYIKYPGFVRLKYMGKMKYEWDFNKYEFKAARFTTSLCTTHHSFARMNHDCNKTHFNKECTAEVEIKGPAICLSCKSTDEDNVVSVFCPQWPSDAREWLYRPRNHGWPTKANLHKIANMGCHVVYAQHRDCRDDEYQWRLSFSQAEVVLLRSWTKTQQLVYHMVRVFAKKELIQKGCPKEKEVLCTYHLKTLMLWTCEQESPEWWNSSLIRTCSNWLHKLLEWLQRRFFPNYFIPEANLFHEQFDPDLCQKIEEYIQSLSDPDILSQWFLYSYILPFCVTKVSDTYHCPCCTEKVLTAHKALDGSLAEHCRIASIEASRNKYEILASFDKTFFTNANRDSDLSCEKRIWQELEKCTDGWKQHSFTARCLFVTSENPSVYFISLTCMIRASNEIAWKKVSCYKRFLSDVITLLLRQFPSFWPKCNNFPQNYETHFDEVYVSFLRAQEYMEEMPEYVSDPEFQLLSRLAVECLKNSLTSNKATSKDIRCTALAYMAAICFATSRYETAIELCSAILTDPEPLGSNRLSTSKREPLYAGCLIFIDDVSNIIEYLLLCKQTLDFDGYSEINLDLRLTPEVFAHYILLQSMQRMSEKFLLNWNQIRGNYLMDALLMAVAKRKLKYIRSEVKTSVEDYRLCVYRRSRSFSELINNVRGFSLNEDISIRLLMECSLKKMTSLYVDALKDFCIPCKTLAFCYRMVYHYTCGNHDEVMTLCDQILCEPDIDTDPEEYPYPSLNVVVLPPFSSYFDEETQCLIGLQMLFHAVFDMSAGADPNESRGKPKYWHFENCIVFQRRYLLGRRFLGRYFQLRCMIDRNNSMSEIQTALGKLKCRRLFECTVHTFLRQRLKKTVKHSQ